MRRCFRSLKSLKRKLTQRSRQRRYVSLPLPLDAFLGLAQLFELRKRPIGGIAALFLCRINQLIEMATVENSHAILDAGILPVDVARIRSHADSIAFRLADSPKRRIADGRIAHIGWIVERFGHRVQYLVLVVAR